MRIWCRTIGIVLILLVAGCAGQGGIAHKQSAYLTPLAGSALTGAAIEEAGQKLTLTVDEVAPEGTFLRINLPEARSIVEQTWQDNGHLIYFAAETEHGIDIGIVPIAGYPGCGISAELTLGAPVRTVSRTSTGAEYEVDDLGVELVSEGIYRLTWTEKNIRGDTNLDGFVIVTDLTGIGQFYNQKPETNPNATWADTNRDGLVNSSDITAIGFNYEVQVAGYVVWRNDVGQLAPDGGPITALRLDTIPGTGPPEYSIELPGEGEDTWYVTPVDSEYPASERGTVSVEVVTDPVVTDPDLLISTEIVGPGLLVLTDDQRTVINDGHQLLRIIDPSDIVNNFEIGERLLIDELGRITVVNEGQTEVIQVAGLPREVPLILEIIFAPIVNLANGGLRPGVIGPLSAIANSDYLVISAIPFTLPADDTKPTFIFAGVQMEEKLVPGTGYNVLTESSCIVNGDADNPDICVRRLDYQTALVSQITAPGHDFIHEVQMMDPDRDSISTTQLNQQLDKVIYGETWGSDLLLTGMIDEAFDEGSGELKLRNVILYNGEDEILVNNYTIHYSEITRFGLVEPDDTIDDPAPMDPSTLSVDDALKLLCYVYKESQEEDAKIWANTVARY